MNPFRIALANIRFPATPDESVALAEQAIAQAAAEGAGIVCFPEAYVPGYRLMGKRVAPPDAAFLERAWSAIAAAAAKARIAVVLGTERLVDSKLLISALVVNSDGTVAGSQDPFVRDATPQDPAFQDHAFQDPAFQDAAFQDPAFQDPAFQDKVQLDPSEEQLYTAGSGRRLFQTGPLKFGIAICHEGWRYPETVRWPARRGAHVVFHPHFHESEPGDYQPASFADPMNSFHEKAALCRAAENTCYFAMVNCAAPRSQTTSAVIRPDGTVQCWQPYGREGLLVADIDLDLATGLLAGRLRSTGE
jgi:predicted amidohydrolase